MVFRCALQRQTKTNTSSHSWFHSKTERKRKLSFVCVVRFHLPLLNAKAERATVSQNASWQTWQTDLAAYQEKQEDTQLNGKSPPPCEFCARVKLGMFFFFFLLIFLREFEWIYNSCLMTVFQMFSKEICAHYWNIRIMAQFTANTVIVWQVCLSPGIPSDFNTRGWSLGCLQVWKCICFLFVCLFFSQWFLKDWQPLQGVTLPLTHCTLGWAPASASHTLLTDWLLMNICIRGVYVSRL